MTIEITAKKVQDAINQGLEQLGATIDEVDVEVLESGGLFKKAKVRMTLEREEKPEEKQVKPAAEKPREKPAEQPKATAEPMQKQQDKAPVVKNDREPARQQQQKPAKQKQTSENRQQQQKLKADASAQSSNVEEKQAEQKKRTPRPEDEAAAKNALEFIETVIRKMGFDATVTADASGELVNVEAADGDDSLIIGRHGETLSALSYLAETTARAEKSHINVIVDCNGYRNRRAASLTAMAKRRADECVRKHRKIKLEAMERVDRRTVHNALTDDARVSTASEGKEPHRYVVIIPKN